MVSPGGSSIMDRTQILKDEKESSRDGFGADAGGSACSICGG